MKIHHIGYLVKHVERAQRALETLGFSVVQQKVRDELRKIDVEFLEKDGYCIELVSPCETDSVVSELRTRIGNSPYHICYEVEDIDSEVMRLRNSCWVVSSGLMAAPALGGAGFVSLFIRILV